MGKLAPLDASVICNTRCLVENVFKKLTVFKIICSLSFEKFYASNTMADERKKSALYFF